MAVTLLTEKVKLLFLKKFSSTIKFLGVTEISVSSFSWRNKRNPAFLLTTFDSEGDYKVNKCYTPDEDNVINAYIGSFILFCVSLMIF